MLNVRAAEPAKPVPESETDELASGLLLLETFKFPVRMPTWVGRNATFTVQVVFVASDAGQLLVSAKGPTVEKAPVGNVRF